MNKGSTCNRVQYILLNIQQLNIQVRTNSIQNQHGPFYEYESLAVGDLSFFTGLKSPAYLSVQKTHWILQTVLVPGKYSNNTFQQQAFKSEHDICNTYQILQIGLICTGQVLGPLWGLESVHRQELEGYLEQKVGSLWDWKPVLGQELEHHLEFLKHY